VKPASRDNNYWSFKDIGDGKVTCWRDLGNFSDEHILLVGELAFDDTFHVTIKIPDLRSWIMETGHNGHARTTFNGLLNINDYSIKDGVFKGNGLPVPWFTRCRDTSA